MEERNNISKLDVDYLFDNFEEFCEIEFKKQKEKTRQPSVVRNLSSLFDRVACNQPAHLRLEPRSHSKSKSQNKERSVKTMLEKPENRDQGKGKLAIKKKLKLNLQDVFHTDSLLKTSKSTAFDSSKAKGLKSLCADSVILKFIKAKTDALNKRSKSRTGQSKKKKSLSKSKKEKLVNPCSTLPNQPRDEGFSKSREKKKSLKLIETCGLKQNYFSGDLPPPPTGSTRIQTVTSRNGSNKRSSSFIETELKLNNQSCRNLKAESFMASTHINTVLNTSKNLHNKLLKRVGEYRQQSQIGMPGSKSSQKSFGKGQTSSKEKRESTSKRQNESKIRYYIPAHIGFKGSKHGIHNSFAHSEEHSKEPRTNYLHQVLFPKLMNKIIPCEESKYDYPQRKMKASKSTRHLG
jgi:hypothetical protein